RLPWHYLPVWMLLTTPPLYTALFVVGAGRTLAALARRPLRTLAEHPADLGFLLAFAVPPAAVILLHCTVYDGWRHLYFVYPAFLFLAVLGLVTLYEASRRLSARFPASPGVFLLGNALPVAATAFTMVQDHPHQYLYFNRLAGRDLHQVKARFELDYWGLSCWKGLEFLVEHDPSPELCVYAPTDPGVFNAFLLPKEQRRRLRYTAAAGEARYLVSHYRRNEDYPPENDVFAVRLRGAKIMVLQKVR